ncbi:MAG: tetratricopeptide repeat protein [Candidatus Portnoybacteria bacterium]|nr:tetratricopeptide repeat protein [Candidatus Portnoybacteria bacterium]
MLLTLIPLVIIVIGAAGVAVIIVKKVPILLKLPACAPEQECFSLSEKIKIRLRSLKYANFQTSFILWIEKTLRKFRVALLKIDNVFADMISGAREKSQIWTIRSRAWMEQHQLRKIKKLQVLEKLDKAQVVETIQKAKDELRQRKQNIVKKEIRGGFDAAAAFNRFEERKLIDLIARNPRDAEAYRKLGFLYCGEENKEDARNCFKQVIKINPGDSEVVAKLRELEK